MRLWQMTSSARPTGTLRFCRLRTYCPKVTVTGRGGARVAEHGSPLPLRFSATRESNC